MQKLGDSLTLMMSFEKIEWHDGIVNLYIVNEKSSFIIDGDVSGMKSYDDDEKKLDEQGI